jgi:predicted dehydrogenase
MMQQPLRIGFIGAGEISQLHFNALRDNDAAKLAGFWSIDPQQSARRVTDFQCRAYPSAEELVASAEIDAVFVLTNLETHLKYTRLALEAGKHVLVEKPVGAAVADIEEMKTIADRKGLLCVPGHNMIHEDSIKRARGLIQNGDLGKVVSCYVMYNIQHSEERAATLPGMVRHILTHNVYTMLYLVGRPRKVTALKSMRHYEKLDKEDLAMALVELESGGIAHLCASFAADDYSADPWTFLVKVIGTAGTVRYTYQDWVEIKKGYSHSHTYTAYQATISNEDACFVDLVRKGGQPLSSMDDAITAQKVIEGCEKSIAEGLTVEIV